MKKSTIFISSVSTYIFQFKISKRHYRNKEQHQQNTTTMTNNQAIVYSNSYQMNAINCRRSSICRSKELIEIGSCWPRILLLSDDESVEDQRRRQRQRKTGFKSIGNIRCNIINPIKIPRRVKQKEMLRQLMKTPPNRRVVSSPISQILHTLSPSTATAPFLSFADQNTSLLSTYRKPPRSEMKTQKRSSLTGKPFVDMSQLLQQDDNKSARSSSSGSSIQCPRRQRKPFKVVVAHQRPN